MRRFLVSFIIVVGCIVGGVLWFLYDSRPLAIMARWSIERALPAVRIIKLEIGKQYFLGPQKVVFQDVSCMAKVLGRILVVQVKTLEISGLETVLSSRKNFPVHWVGADVDFAPGKARGLTAAFEISSGDTKGATVKGSLTAETIMWDKLKAGRTSLRLRSDAEDLELYDILSQAYGGTISGKAAIHFRPASYEADMKLDRLQTSRLSDFNEQISAQMAGRISGGIRVAGDAVRPTSIEAALEMPSGGKVNAALLSALTQYLPQSQEKKRLDILIRNGGKLAVEVFSFTMKSMRPDHLSGMVRLASKDANIELNLTHDIQTDGTWDGLAQYWQAIFK